MGPRSTIKFYEDGKFLCGIYQQYYCYASGVGTELKEFIKSREWVNGYQNNEQFNGFGCFIARFISEFKTGTGGLYITNEEDSQEYNYVVEFNSETNEINLYCKDIEDDEEGYPYDEVINLREINNGKIL